MLSSRRSRSHFSVRKGGEDMNVSSPFSEREIVHTGLNSPNESVRSGQTDPFAVLGVQGPSVSDTLRRALATPSEDPDHVALPIVPLRASGIQDGLGTAREHVLFKFTKRGLQSHNVPSKPRGLGTVAKGTAQYIDSAVTPCSEVPMIPHNIATATSSVIVNRDKGIMRTSEQPGVQRIISRRLPEGMPRKLASQRSSLQIAEIPGIFQDSSRSLLAPHSENAIVNGFVQELAVKKAVRGPKDQDFVKIDTLAVVTQMLEGQEEEQIPPCEVLEHRPPTAENKHRRYLETVDFAPDIDLTAYDDGSTNSNADDVSSCSSSRNSLSSDHSNVKKTDIFLTSLLYDDEDNCDSTHVTSALSRTTDCKLQVASTSSTKDYMSTLMPHPLHLTNSVAIPQILTDTPYTRPASCNILQPSSYHHNDDDIHIMHISTILEKSRLLLEASSICIAKSTSQLSTNNNM